MGAFAGEDFVACFGYEDVVFDSYAEPAGDVYAGLDCDDLAGFEFSFAVRFEEGGFVDFEAEAVSCAVAVNGQVGLVNYLSRGGIDLSDFHAGLYRFYRCCLSLLYDIVDLLIESRHPTYYKATGNVAAIAVVSGAEVDKYGVLFPELSSAGLMVRPGPVGAEGHDRLETVARPQLADLKIEHAGQLALGYAGFDVRQGLCEGLC